MYKLSKIVLVLEPDETKASIYNGALESSGFIVKVVQNEKEFFKIAELIIPDILIINGTNKEIADESICKLISKHTTLKEAAVIVLVTKINFASKAKLEKLPIDALEEFPLQNNNFLQTIKKNAKKRFIPQVEITQNNEIIGNMHIDLIEISETKLSFTAPVKLNSHAHVEIHSELLDSFGIVNKNFEAGDNGVYSESKVYKNRVDFRGISVKVLKEIKSYCNLNKEKI